MLVKGLAGNSDAEKEIYDRLLAFISTEHTVKEVTGTASKGSYNLDTGVICVRSNLEYLQKIKTLLHEYAHAIDYNGVVKGEGIGITNTREGKYAKTNGYAVQNTVLKMAKKRALVDAALNVGNLSARFTQDVEDMNIEPDSVGGKNLEELKPKALSSKPATKKQIAFLEKLMQEANSSPEAMNRYVQKHYNIDDYHSANTLIVSELIEKFQAAKQ